MYAHMHTVHILVVTPAQDCLAGDKARFDSLHAVYHPMASYNVLRQRYDCNMLRLLHYSASLNQDTIMQKIHD